MSLLRACGKFPTMHTYIPVDHWLPPYTAASRTLFDNIATNVCAYQKFCKLTIAVFGIPDRKRIMYRDSLSYDCVKFLAWVIAWMTMHNLPRSHLVHSLLVPYLSKTQYSFFTRRLQLRNLVSDYSLPLLHAPHSHHHQISTLCIHCKIVFVFFTIHIIVVIIYNTIRTYGVPLCKSGQNGRARHTGSRLWQSFQGVAVELLGWVLHGWRRKTLA